MRGGGGRLKGSERDFGSLHQGRCFWGDTENFSRLCSGPDSEPAYERAGCPFALQGARLSPWSACLLPSTAAPGVASRGAVALWGPAGLRCANSMNLMLFAEVQIGFLHRWPTAPAVFLCLSLQSLRCLSFVSDATLLQMFQPSALL